MTDLATDMRVQAIALILKDEEYDDFTVRKALGFDARFQREARIKPQSSLAVYLCRHPEPISHSQLEAALGAQAPVREARQQIAPVRATVQAERVRAIVRFVL